MAGYYAPLLHRAAIKNFTDEIKGVAFHEKSRYFTPVCVFHEKCCGREIMNIYVAGSLTIAYVV